MPLTIAGINWVQRRFNKVVKINKCTGCKKIGGINELGFCKKCWAKIKVEQFV